MKKIFKLLATIFIALFTLVGIGTIVFLAQNRDSFLQNNIVDVNANFAVPVLLEPNETYKIFVKSQEFLLNKNFNCTLPYWHGPLACDNIKIVPYTSYKKVFEGPNVNPNDSWSSNFIGDNKLLIDHKMYILSGKEIKPIMFLSAKTNYEIKPEELFSNTSGSQINEIAYTGINPPLNVIFFSDKHFFISPKSSNQETTTYCSYDTLDWFSRNGNFKNFSNWLYNESAAYAIVYTGPCPALKKLNFKNYTLVHPLTQLQNTETTSTLLTDGYIFYSDANKVDVDVETLKIDTNGVISDKNGDKNEIKLSPTPI